jgi:hypothetical protein
LPLVPADARSAAVLAPPELPLMLADARSAAALARADALEGLRRSLPSGDRSKTEKRSSMSAVKQVIEMLEHGLLSHDELAALREKVTRQDSRRPSSLVSTMRASSASPSARFRGRTTSTSSAHESENKVIASRSRRKELPEGMVGEGKGSGSIVSMLTTVNFAMEGSDPRFYVFRLNGLHQKLSVSWSTAAGKHHNRSHSSDLSLIII